MVGQLQNTKHQLHTFSVFLCHKFISVGKLDTGDQELVLRLKSQLSDKERSLEDREDKIKSQDEEISNLKEQVCGLIII